MQPFVPPSPTDSRSPCPALNSLANHSLIPHEGRNLTLSQLVAGLKAAYNVSTPLAYVLSLVGLVACGTGGLFSRTLDLRNLALHNRIEHDASIVHADAAPGAQFAPLDDDPHLLDAFLASCPHMGMGWNDLVKVRAQREATLSTPLNFFRSTLASSEAVSTLDRLSDPETKTMSRERLEAWFGENRFPEDWSPPPTVQGLFSIASRTSKFRQQVQDLREAYTGDTKADERNPLLNTE